MLGHKCIRITLLKAWNHLLPMPRMTTQLLVHENWYTRGQHKAEPVVVEQKKKTFLANSQVSAAFPKYQAYRAGIEPR